ncbi:MAG TPA: NrtA/SsuA/CpmA family ABC transporter substrate-binding protein, partial [Hyphomicrobium sp.]|nr:NrtA/SsuA/CpmA family ABC transporter substrate-binding protein [Hyphomicrobium sp.]
MRSAFIATLSAAAVLGFGITAGHAADTVRLAQNLSPISGVVIVAKEKGFFEKHGLNVEVSNFTSGKKALDAVLGGGADIATTAEAPTTAAALSKQPIAFLARIEYSDLKTLTRKASGINTLADLKGKKIGFTAGTGGEIYTQELLKKAGLKASDVELTNIPPHGLAAALSAGSIDAYNTWEPHIFKGKKALGDEASELDTKGIYAETFNLVVLQDYLAKNKDAIERFLKAAIMAEAWIKAHREEAIAVVAEAVSLSKEELAPIWDDYVYNVVLDDKQLEVLKTH